VSVTTDEVREAFARMLASRAAIAIAGKVPKGITEHAAEVFPSPSGRGSNAARAVR